MPTLNELNPETWSRQHFGTCELGDVRRTRRLVRYAQQMAEKPDASTPQQTECWSDCKAVYELFRRTEVTFNAVTAAHNRHTLSLPAGKYLAISDTAEVDYGYKSERRGLGPLTSKNHRGFFLHSAVVVDTKTREVMGLGAQELKPPKGCEALRWVLYTKEPVSSFQECLEVIEYYEQRPIVEEYHQCLKTGLQIEERQYETGDRLKPVIGVICVQAVRLLQLRDVARTAPDTPARNVVPLEWLAVLALVLRNPRPLKTVRDFMRALASHGGFLSRKSDGEPGWKTIWRGLETLLVAIRGYRAARKRFG